MLKKEISRLEEENSGLIKCLSAKEYHSGVPDGQ
jgi:hypothetical protein